VRNRLLKWTVWCLAGLAALAAAGVVYERLSEARDAAHFPAPGRLVDVGGRRLHLLCKGAGPTVVMVAGGGTPAVVSYVLQDKIAVFARVCSYDRAGLGWSDPVAHPLTFDGQVNDLETLLHRAHIPGPYFFVPESFGSLIVIDYAARHRDETAGVVFVDGVDPKLWFAAMVEQGGFDADVKNAGFGAAWHLGLVRLAFAHLAPGWVWTLPPTIRGEMTALYSRPSPGYDEALQAYRVSPLRPVLRPSMLGNDPVVAIRHGVETSELSSQFEMGWKASQERLAGMSRSGSIMIANGASHELAQEEPDLVALAVRNALAAQTKRAP
jgi:pimeloyl-ACP methyl ester carboxylesterase